MDLLQVLEQFPNQKACIKHLERIRWGNKPLMSDCLLRISEVVAVNVRDFKAKTLTLRASKTDQEGAGETLYICDNTRALLKQYRARAGITRGAVFRHIRRGGHVQSDRLTTVSARRIIQKRAADAGVEGFISGMK